jgi:hypothetical protein
VLNTIMKTKQLFVGIHCSIGLLVCLLSGCARDHVKPTSGAAAKAGGESALGQAGTPATNGPLLQYNWRFNGSPPSTNNK